jgi:hypothetical protein
MNFNVYVNLPRLIMERNWFDQQLEIAESRWLDASTALELARNAP